MGNKRKHHRLPVAVEGIDQLERGRDEIVRDLPLGDQVHDGQKQERLVRRAKTGEARPAVPAPICI